MPEKEVKKGPWFGVRHLQAVLIFAITAVHLAERLNVSVSLVAMTDAATTNPNFHEFHWNEKQKSYIVSAFYWGYVLTQFPAGYMAGRLGVKLTLLTATLGSSLCTLIVPLCVYWGGWQIYCAIRFLQGLFQGLIFPSFNEHLATWAPCEELTRLGGLCYTGIDLGSIIAMGVSGILAASAIGWPGISYLFGGTGILACVVWMVYAENNPFQSKSISAEEREYILSSQQKVEDARKSKIPVPWKAIFTSTPFWSLNATAMCQLWGFSMMQAYIPPYMHGVLKMDIKSNAFFSTLPFVTMWALSYVFTFGADIFLAKKWASLVVVRKTINTLSMWGPAASLFAIGFLDENQKTLAVVLMTINVALNAGHVVGLVLNSIDLSPNHAGILMGILNALANTTPIFSPLAIGKIVSDESDRTQWQIAFTIAASLFFLGNLQWLFLGTSDIQPWNDEHFLRTQNHKTKPPNNALNYNPELGVENISNLELVASERTKEGLNCNDPNPNETNFSKT